MVRRLLPALLLALPLSANLIAADTSALRPPPGSKVALVEFEDLECPDCARAAPLVEEAARTYHIPLVRHDFPLPQHPWAFDAAVLARWFDAQSKQLGVDFRLYIFQNQNAISAPVEGMVTATPEAAAQCKQLLHSYADKFAAEHKLQIPFMVDPKGELAAKVRADRDIGTRVGLEHTPTIYVVTSKTQGTPFVEVVDRTQLFQMIEQAKRETGDTGRASAAGKPAAKRSAKKTGKT